MVEPNKHLDAGCQSGVALEPNRETIADLPRATSSTRSGDPLALVGRIAVKHVLVERSPIRLGKRPSFAGIRAQVRDPAGRAVVANDREPVGAWTRTRAPVLGENGAQLDHGKGVSSRRAIRVQRLLGRLPTPCAAARPDAESLCPIFVLAVGIVAASFAWMVIAR